MPSPNRWLGDHEGTFGGRLLQTWPWIETPFTSTLKKGLPRGPILNQEITRMIFNEDGIISGKPMNRKKILVCGWNMKKFVKVKIVTRRLQGRFTNISISHT
jgi:hypothetical protein